MSSALIICTLLCRGHFNLFKLALPSWRSGLSPQEVRVHDDGSLTEEQVFWIEEQGCFVLRYGAATATVVASLTEVGLSDLLHLRQSDFRLSLKLSDIILLNRDKEEILFLDADVFCLRRCVLRQLVDGIAFCGMHDIDHGSYRLSFWPASKKELPYSFNTGVLYFRPNAIDLRLFNNYLSGLRRTFFHMGEPWVIEQTGWAIAATQQTTRVFAPELVLVPDSPQMDGAAIWHLAGADRKRRVPEFFDSESAPVELRMDSVAWAHCDDFLARAKWRVALGEIREHLSRWFTGS